MLEKVELNLSLSTGIDTKTDSKIVEGRLLTLENAEIRNGIVVKSTGYDNLDPTYPSNDTSSNKALIPVGDSVVLVDDDKIGIYNTSNSKFNYIDSFGSCGKSVVTVDSNIQDFLQYTPAYVPVLGGIATAESSKYIVTATCYQTYSNDPNDTTTVTVSISVVEKSTFTLVKKYLKTIGSQLTSSGQNINVACTDNFFALYVLNDRNAYDLKETVYDYNKNDPVSSDVTVATGVFSWSSIEVSNIGNISYILYLARPVSPNPSAPTLVVRNFETQTTIAAGLTFSQLTIYGSNQQPADEEVCINNRVINVVGKGNVVALAAGITFALIDPANNTVWRSFSYPNTPTMPIVSLGYLSDTNEFLALKSYKQEGLINNIPLKRIPVVNRYSLTTNSWTFLSDISRFKTVTVNGVPTNVLSNYFGYEANAQLGVCMAASALMCTSKKAYYIQVYYAYPFLNSSTDTYPVTIPPQRPSGTFKSIASEVKCSLLLMDSDYNVCDRFVDYNGSYQTNLYFNKINTGAIGLDNINISYPLVASLLANVKDPVAGTNISSRFSYDVRLHRLTTKVNYPIKSGRINNAVVVSSPSLYEINNNQLTEQNFYDFPQLLVSPSNQAGTLTGSYSFKAIFEHTDGSGNVVRSSESITKQIQLTNNNVIIGITVPPWFTKRTNQKIKIYATQANGNTFNLLYSVNQTMRPLGSGGNTPQSVSTWTYRQTATADQISALNFKSVDDAVDKELIYTSGGILPAFPLPSAITNVVHNNRVFCVPHYNKNLIRYTKPIQVGIATESFLGLDIIIESRGGDIVELSSLDEKLIVFKKNSIYGIQGDGFDDSGNGSTFSVPYLINSPVGCSEPLSVVRIPDGIMFKSTKGIYLLNRSVTVSYIGAPVEKFNNEKIVSSVIIETENKVKFTTNAGNVLTYDYYYGVWYTESGLAFVGTSLIQGKFCGVFNTGKVWLNNPTSYLRDGAQYSMKVQTAWLRLKGLQGYSRAYRIYLLGDYKDTHSINIDVSYDYNETVAHTVNYVPVLNSPSQPIQARVNFERQKCQSVRLTFTDVSTGATGNSLTMTDLSILAGVKRGFNKVLPSQTTSV
jgi:hypothetical protein